MSHNKMISVIILSHEGSWTKGLITTILGKNVSDLHKRKTQKNTEIYENETYKLVHIPHKPWDDIKDLCCKHPDTDMCLLVVDTKHFTFSAQGEDVWKEINNLSTKTGKPTEEFIVVLPLGYEPKDYPFKSYTIQQLFNELEKLAKERQLGQTNKRFGPHTAMASTGGRCSKDPFTDHKKSLKSETCALKMGLNLEKGNHCKTGKHTSIQVNLVLLGMTGAGKSASGNTILGEKAFFSKPSSMPVTTECNKAEKEINGLHVRVIDTPDIFDDDIKSPVREKHVKTCQQLCESEPCVFVLVIHVSRFTDGERNILKKLEKAFGSKVSEQTVILFTRGDDLQQGEMSFEDFLHRCQPGLKKIVDKCGKRCVVFENSRSSSDQVEKLMDTVTMMIPEKQK